MVKRNDSWFQKNKDWVKCNAVYSGILAFGIAECGLFCKLLSIPDCHGILNVFRYAGKGLFFVCLLICAAILAFAVFAPFYDWVMHLFHKKEERCRK